MGSCVSLHRSSESAMKLRLSFGSKNDKLEIPPSPNKEKLAAGDVRIKDIALSDWSPPPSAKPLSDFGSKEEAFFDSNPWLESDSEDFYSVNGDFTPSRGNTPVNNGLSQPNKSPFEARIPRDSIPTPSPTTPTTEKKKRLLELFRESIRDDEEAANARNSGANGTPEVKHSDVDLPPKSVRGTPFLSGANSMCSSERTPNGDSIILEDEKPMRSVQCCLSGLVSCRSFSERKKKMSPAIAINDRA